MSGSAVNSCAPKPKGSKAGEPVAEVDCRWCSKCSKTKPIGEFNRNKSRPGGVAHWCRACQRLSGRETYARLRADVITAYGGTCACCGESVPQFLALDHVNGDGAAHKRKLAAASGRASLEGRNASLYVYREVRRLGYPRDRFRLLCHNCNVAMGTHGQCPHQTNKETTNAE